MLGAVNLVEPTIITYVAAAQASRSPSLILPWEKTRLDALHAKATSESNALFERSCARGQLAASRQDWDSADEELLSTLNKFWRIYPHNDHLFQHLLQLALAMASPYLAALFLNDRFGVKDLFSVVFQQSADDPTVNRVIVSGFNSCRLFVDPRIPGRGDADYLVSHWSSCAPLWTSYCRVPNCERGTLLMNTGEAGVLAGLAYCGNRPEFILVPDGYFMTSLGYRELRSLYSEQRLAWNDRVPIGFWRGATTGTRINQADWRTLPRVILSEISLANQADLDAALSNIVQSFSDFEKSEIIQRSLVKDRVKQEEFLKYKYQIDIDGNSNSWPGLFQKLLTGSPVLKVESRQGYAQWYYDRLKPWKNFVPVVSDMSDLVEKIQWLRAHDELAMNIGEAGLQLAESLQLKNEIEASHNVIKVCLRASGDPFEENSSIAKKLVHHPFPEPPRADLSSYGSTFDDIKALKIGEDFVVYDNSLMRLSRAPVWGSDAVCVVRIFMGKQCLITSRYAPLTFRDIGDVSCDAKWIGDWEVVKVSDFVHTAHGLPLSSYFINPSDEPFGSEAIPLKGAFDPYFEMLIRNVIKVESMS